MRAITFKMCPSMLAFSLLIVPLVFSPCPSAFAGSILGWGYNYFGQATPPTGNNYIAISAGWEHSLAIRSDGSIVGWGSNYAFGQEPYNYYGQATPPDGNDYIAISAGAWHSLALRSDGTIVGWGYNYYGQATPPVGNNYIAISAGGYHSLALRSDGTIVGWGWNGYGHGQATPPDGNDYIAVDAGGSHSLALRSDGSIVGWGSNYDGEATPPDGNNFVAISAGGYHSIALRSDGTIVGWGNNWLGQATPPADNNFVAISAGKLHSLALRSDLSAALGIGGSIVGWGSNFDGYGNWSGQATPPAGNDFGAIAAGGWHSLGLNTLRLEINQCFQQTTGTVQQYDLIETKPFVARVTLEKYSPGGLTTKVKLAVYNADTWQQIGQTKQKTTTINPQSPKTFDFFFNDNETKDMKAGNYEFSLRVEYTAGNKLFEWKGIYPFKSSETIRMLAVQLLMYNWSFGFWSNSYIEFAEQVFPVPKTTVSGVNHFEIVRYSFLNSGQSLDRLLLDMDTCLQKYNTANPAAPARFICAVLPDGILPDNAVGMRRGSSVLITPRSDSKYILGHETGHIYGLGEEYVSSDLWVLDQTFNFANNPPPLKLDPSGPFIIGARRPYAGQRCDWADDRSSYDNPFSYFDNQGRLIWWCDGRYVVPDKAGYDVKNKREVRFFPSSPVRNTLTMMSAAGGSNWISGPEYKSLIAELVPTAPKSTAVSATAAPLTSSQRMLVSGIIDIPAKTAEISPLIPVPNLELSQEVSDPNCQLVFKSSTGTVLDTFNFALLEGEDPNCYLEGPFSVVVDLPDDTARIQVTIDGTVADELRLTDNSPIVSVLSPNGGEQITGELLITWSASDTDNNDLSYTIEFSHNNGTEWNSLTIDHQVNELTIDANYLPGGPNCLVKVTVSDGWNSAEDISDASFSIVTKPPEVTILDPEDGTILLASEGMQGRCTAYDPETGNITDPNAIVWSSNIDGFLGNGNLVGFELSLGDHVLSATVTDPEAKTATDTVSVTVVANLADFNYDRRVDFLDLAEFAEKWQATCSAPNWCDRTDLDHSGNVDFADLAELSENWLW